MFSYFHRFYLVSHSTDTPRQNASFSFLMTEKWEKLWYFANILSSERPLFALLNIKKKFFQWWGKIILTHPLLPKSIKVMYPCSLKPLGGHQVYFEPATLLKRADTTPGTSYPTLFDKCADFNGPRSWEGARSLRCKFVSIQVDSL